jgi:catechol 2,3-dioxygenase-like lactoylglutathione lyase family enzyme
MIAGGHVTLAVTDLGRAIRFYVEVLGMKLVATDARTGSIDAGDGLVIVLLSGRRQSADKFALGTAMPDSLLGLRVKSELKDVVAVLENRGITFVLQGDAPHTRAHFRDPDDNDLYLFYA